MKVNLVQMTLGVGRQWWRLVQAAEVATATFTEISRMRSVMAYKHRLQSTLNWLTHLITDTHTHLTAPFQGLPGWAGTRKVKPIWILLKQWVAVASARHMQVCTSLQTDNHTSTSPLSFLQTRCPSCCPTNSVKALKAQSQTSSLGLIFAVIQQPFFKWPWASRCLLIFRPWTTTGENLLQQVTKLKKLDYSRLQQVSPLWELTVLFACDRSNIPVFTLSQIKLGPDLQNISWFITRLS